MAHGDSERTAGAILRGVPCGLLRYTSRHPAGYSPKTAQEQSSRLLSNVMVQERIATLMAKRLERTQTRADNVIAELKRSPMATCASW